VLDPEPLAEIQKALLDLGGQKAYHVTVAIAIRWRWVCQPNRLKR
jgi:hypothetical protein